MAYDILKINKEQMQSQIDDIKQALEDYIAFGEKPFDEEITSLEDMNTDFVVKFNVMLGDLNAGNDGAIKSLTEIVSLAESILLNFQKIDDKAVAEMGFNREE